MNNSIGRKLPGSLATPNVRIIEEKPAHPLALGNFRAQPCTLNSLGIYPIISTVSGTYRLSMGVIHTVKHLACAIFSRHRQAHLQEAALGAKNIGIGLIEIIPIIGNIVMLVRGRMLVKKNIKIYRRMESEQYNNCAVLFEDGRVVAQMPLGEYRRAISANQILTMGEKSRFIKQYRQAIEPVNE
jgi:hypothetical protein